MSAHNQVMIKPDQNYGTLIDMFVTGHLNTGKPRPLQEVSQGLMVRLERKSSAGQVEFKPLDTPYNC